MSLCPRSSPPASSVLFCHLLSPNLSEALKKGPHAHLNVARDLAYYQRQCLVSDYYYSHTAATSYLRLHGGVASVAAITLSLPHSPPSRILCCIPTSARLTARRPLIHSPVPVSQKSPFIIILSERGRGLSPLFLLLSHIHSHIHSHSLEKMSLVSAHT